MLDFGMYKTVTSSTEERGGCLQCSSTSVRRGTGTAILGSIQPTTLETDK